MPIGKPPSPEPTFATARPDADAETREGFVAFVRGEYQRRLHERRPFEQQWLLNMAFVEGNQYATVHKLTGEIYVPEKSFAWESRDVFNLTAPVYETRLAKLTRNRSHMVVRPGSPEEQDVNAAKVATKLLQYNVEELDFDSLQAEAVSWAELCGSSFYKHLWNPGRGPGVPDPSNGETVPLGDVETVVCSAFEILPDNLLKPRLDDQRSLIHGKAWPIDSDHVQVLVDMFKQQTGEEVKLSPEDVHSVTLGRGPASQNGLPELRFATMNLKSHIVILEYYERPSRKFPAGRFAIVANQHLLYYGELPYKEDLSLPFVKVDSIRRPNCFWGKSVVERLIPIQRRYNAVRNRMSDYLNRVGIGQWSVEQGTVDLDTLTNEPGLVVEYSRGARPPQPVAHPPLPGTFMEEMSQLQDEFMSTSGIHEVSHAQLPRGTGGTPSGVLVAQLQEQDDTRLATTQRYLDEAVQKTGRQWLMRYKEFMQERRIFQVMGKNKTVQVLDFGADDIRSYNVVVEASSALANTPAARRDTVFAMLDRGLFNDPETGNLSAQGLQKVFEMLEFGNWEDFEEDKALPQSRAQWENHLMSMGQMIPVRPWEDHLIHLQMHRRHQQTDDFYGLIEGPSGPEVAAIFEAHVQQHMMALTAGMMPPQATAGAPGAPPAEGPPSGEQVPGTGMSMAQQAAQIEATKGAAAADAFVRGQMGGGQSGGAQ